MTLIREQTISTTSPASTVCEFQPRLLFNKRIAWRATHARPVPAHVSCSEIFFDLPVHTSCTRHLLTS
jgi:hypothetical protein